MNIQRSPTGSDSNVGRSGSQPNLSTASNSILYKDTSDTSTITFRKKHKRGDDDEVHAKLSGIQNQMTEMMTLLTTSINTQNESTTRIRGDIAAINNQILEIKKSMDMTDQKISNLAKEQTETKVEVQNLIGFTHTTDMKIASLESDVHKLQVSSTNSALHVMASYDDVLAELSDQSNRKKNVLIAGIQEIKSNNVEKRMNSDRAEVLKTIHLISTNCPEPIRIMRVGKYNSAKNRALKVCFESEETAKIILRNKSKLKSSVLKIFADQTPHQQTRFKNLKEELSHRAKAGESNLIIKYVKGIPQIVSAPPKN